MPSAIVAPPLNLLGIMMSTENVGISPVKKRQKLPLAVLSEDDSVKAN